MAREWVAAGSWLLLAIGCGARTGLLVDSETGEENAGGVTTSVDRAGKVSCSALPVTKAVTNDDSSF